MDEIKHKPEYIARDRTGDVFPGLSPKNLANLASMGKGPSYYKCGRRCFYSYKDLVAWITRHPVKTKIDL